MYLKNLVIIYLTLIPMVIISLILYCHNKEYLWSEKYSFAEQKERKGSNLLLDGIQNETRMVLHSLQTNKTYNTSLESTATNNSLIDCSNVPLQLRGYEFDGSKISQQEYTWKTVNAFIKSLPEQIQCKNKRKAAIIVPYRNREQQLMIFLQHIIPILRRQNINHTIFIIEQKEGAPFNRAKLLNVGFMEASKVDEFDCYFFHDVDILLENDKCLYCADDGLMHFATKLNKFGYKPLVYGMPTCIKGKASWSKLPYFGGITRVTKSLMHAVNGFSNIYWAWGAEDDDFYLRILKKGFIPSFNEDPQCTFSMLKHNQEKHSTSKNFLLKHFDSRTEFDGLNSLNYSVVAYNRGELYTNILVDIGYPSYHLTHFTGGNIQFCKVGDSWVKENVFNIKSKNKK